MTDHQNRPNPTQQAERITLGAIVHAAVSATGAHAGWLLRVDPSAFTVVAAERSDDDGAPISSAVGKRRPHVGVAGYVLSSGQASAVQARAGDLDNAGAGNCVGDPGGLLAVPCVRNDVVAVIELCTASDRRFTFDDVEIVSLLSDIAAAAIVETGVVSPAPEPRALGALLNALHRSDPVRYDLVARFVDGLM